MSRRSVGIRTATLVLGVCASLLGCGGKERITSSGGGGAGASGVSGAGSVTAGASGVSGGSTVGAMRVPARHRASGSKCPEQRAAINPTPVDPLCNSAESSICKELFSCTQDSNCTEGSNGRCDSGGIGPRHLSCSYDACSSDAECAGKAPCECRASMSDSAANTCITQGECRVDADCGRSGYCSPSQVGGGCFCPSAALCDGTGSCSPGPCVCGDACGHGYFCHTPTDTCLDDADCGTNSSCNYDTIEKRWTCSECWGIP